MSLPENKLWWQRVRGKNRSLKGFISARRRFAARMDRLAGKEPTKRQYSVPAISRRIGTTLTILKRVIRGQDEASSALLQRLAKDLDMPVRELKMVMESRTESGAERGRLSLLEGFGGGDDPYQVLEDGLIQSARMLVRLLRNCVEQGQGAASSFSRRQGR